MKKYLKKLGVLTLIAALLAPYVYIPEVKAQTSSNSCTKHLNTYLFMDKSKIYKYDEERIEKEGVDVWLEKLIEEEGSKTWANVPISIPSSTSTEKVTIKTVEKNNLQDEDDLEKFWQIYIDNTSRLSSMDILEKYGETFTEYTDFLQNDSSFYEMSDYDSISAIFHGKWSNEFENRIAQENNFDNRIKTVSQGVNLSLQTLLTDTIMENMDVSYKNAMYKNNYSNAKYFETPRSMRDINVSYFQDLIDGKLDSYTYNDGYQTYFSTTVFRTVDLDKSQFLKELNELTFGLENPKTDSTKTCDYGVYYDYVEGNTYTKPTNSFDGLKQGDWGCFEKTETNNMTVDIKSSDDVDIDTDTSYYWPAVINVEYEVCETANTPTTQPSNPTTKPNEDVKYWNIQYTAKTEDAGTVTNLPSKHSEKLGTNSKVANGVPEKEGFAFKGWCVGTETCTNLVKAGDTLTSPDKEGTITLYAQWGEAGPGEQEKTGVMSYVLGLSAVALVAGGIYYVSKKKNLFKQI